MTEVKMTEEINKALSDINNIFEEIDEIYDYISYNRLGTEYIARGIKGNLKYLEGEEIDFYLKKILPELIEAKRLASDMRDNAIKYESSVHKLIIKIDNIIDETDTNRGQSDD